VNPRTPVLVNCAELTPRLTGSEVGREPLEEMFHLVHALAPARLLERVGLVLVPKGTWRYADPGRAIGDSLGADARSVLAEVGVLQQTLVTRACLAIAAGEADAVLVVGFESKRSDLVASRQGTTREEIDAPGPPDELLLPDDDVLTRAEIERDLAVPAHQYAIVENALRHADGLDLAAQIDRLGRLWSDFAAVATTEDRALDQSGPSPTDITSPSADNRMIASPYTKRLCSQWNVDQAVALLFASAEAAAAHGAPRENWIFPAMAAESNHMTPMPARAELHRSPATRLLGDVLTEHAGLKPGDVTHLDLYSCFPAAVQVQARELRIGLDRPLTVTGGMTFFGGPLNSYALHAIAAMARRLRREQATGLVTSVSGMLTKTALGLWSSTPPTEPFRTVDVSAAAERKTPLQPLDPDLTGPVRVVGATVVHDRGAPSRVVAVVESDDGTRSVAVDGDRITSAQVVDDDLTGWAAQVPAPGVLAIGG
jgi:acetyl-CoA C-acetyltransferase